MPEIRCLSSNVRRYRHESGLSQPELAWRCGLGEHAIRWIECQNCNPRLSTLQSIAAYTGMTVAELLTEPKTPLEEVQANDV